MNTTMFERICKRTTEFYDSITNKKLKFKQGESYTTSQTSAENTVLVFDKWVEVPVTIFSN